MQDTLCPLPDLTRIKAMKRPQSHCVGCGGQINDQYILRVAPNLEWHGACLKCTECGINLDESCTCFVRDGKTYCKQDYLRLFGFKCARCSQMFHKNDLVMKAKNKIYHLACFKCDACHRQLQTGDEFAMREEGLYCRMDNDEIERSQNNNNNSPCNSLDDNKDTDDSLTQEIKSNATSPEHPGDGGANGSGSGHPRKEKGHKTTRVRTVLNEKQLHTLRTCYAANPRPDALMKEQLVEMTGLSPRVIRVWFQNKRCKDKKRSIMMKQMQQHQQDKPTSYLLQQGVPMVASSPVRHEPPLQATPVEVQSYSTPWKSLADFANMADLDPGAQAPFQQLVSAFGEFPSSDDDSVVTLEEPPPLPRDPRFVGHVGYHHGYPPPEHIMTSL